VVEIETAARRKTRGDRFEDHAAESDGAGARPKWKPVKVDADLAPADARANRHPLQKRNPRT
jgi:hypothetical protein